MEWATIDSIKLSRFAFGCEPLGGTDWGCVDLKAIESSILLSLDHGVNFFDTAATYGLGLSEERLARILKGRSSEIVISTKIGLHWPEPRDSSRASVQVDNSRQGLFSSLEGSLKRLGLDSVPLAFIHRHDPTVSAYELAESITQIKRRGLAGHVGVSNFSLDQLLELHKLVRIPIVQILFSAAENGEERRRYLASAAEKGILVSTYGVLNRGLLSGKYNYQSTFTESDRRSRLPDFKGEELEKRMRVLKRISDVARELSVSIPQVAIAWALQTPGVSAAILGIKNREQLLDNLQALTIRLSLEQYHRIAEAEYVDVSS